MARKEVLRGIPDREVNQVVADFKSEGAEVTKEKENGTWEVTAIFPE